MRSGASIELFAYPWDIVDRGVGAFVDECAGLGVNRLHVTTLYHSGKFLLPRRRRQRVYSPESGHLLIPLPEAAFAGPIRPRVSALASSGWLEDLAKASRDRGIDLAAWTVFHHGSTLAAGHPDLTIRNVFGDAYPFAVCPSHRAVADYSLALAKAVWGTGVFQTLDLETIGYLGYAHGHHHEVTAVPAGPLENFLLSLCFCPACKENGQRDGIPMERLRGELERVLMAKLRADDAAGRHPDNMEQVSTLMALNPDLQQLIRLRVRTVSELVRRIRDVVQGGELSVFTSSFVGSPSNIWMEGVSLPELRQVADTFHLLAYTPDTDAVNGDLVFCLAQVEDAARLNLTLNLGLPITPDLGHAMGKIEFAWKLGVRRFAFFNYGFLGEGRLRWIGEISAALQSKGTA